MIRVLFLTTAAGIGVCILCLSIAMAIGGSDMVRNGGWKLGPHVHVDLDGHHGDTDDDDDVGGPTTTRDLAWDGATRLEIDAPADVTYTQAPGPAKLTVTGPRGAVGQVSVSHGAIDYDGPDRGPRLQIVLTAPDVESFSLDGDSHLSIRNYDRGSLKLEMDGRADADAQGKAGQVDVEMSGHGKANLGRLAAQDAHVEISGSGSASLSPKDSADIEISGSGDVTLYGHTARVKSELTGSGEVHTDAGPPPAPAPADSAAPAVSAAPAKPPHVARPAAAAKPAPGPAPKPAPAPAAASPAAKTAT
ncbi:GIN domain-containing protein [Caulobacter sp. KR2-114]|uniref:GIN domain-containing protein n=1 Tax=Caulobacter sp. KR2-114 TaxID=3400912 RepID=UPI003C0DE842